MARKPGTGRAQRRRALQDAAARITLPARTDLCIVGGGAAGLVAAISAAEAGAEVVVLERDVACGRTILATGNGRCNFANAYLDPGLYNDPPFVREVCGETWLDDILNFFTGCGLAWEFEGQGRLYPLSRQAASVRNVLLARAQRAGVLLAPAREVAGVSPTDRGFDVEWRQLFGEGRAHALSSERLIVATGGGTTSPCTTLGLREAPSQPLLCPLACEGPALDELDGRRARALVTLLRDGREVLHEEGEVLFRPYGLSGIVIFNLSRHVHPQDEVVVDLLPRLQTSDAHRLAACSLDGLLDPLIAQALRRHGGNDVAAVELAKALTYRVLGPTDTTHAQVNRGGLLNRQFEPSTLEAREASGFFACGEALDVDGPCGGFNLAWAWKSGLVAGAAAAG